MVLRMLLLGQMVLVRGRHLVRMLLLVLVVVVREVEIGTPTRAKIEVECHAGQEKGGSPGRLDAR